MKKSICIVAIVAMFTCGLKAATTEGAAAVTGGATIHPVVTQIAAGIKKEIEATGTKIAALKKQLEEQQKQNKAEAEKCDKIADKTKQEECVKAFFKKLGPSMELGKELMKLEMRSEMLSILQDIANQLSTSN